MWTILISVLLSIVSASLFTEEEYQYLFVKFVREHKKQYDAAEFMHRFNVFKSNLDFVITHNAGEHSYTTAINKFGDITAAELATFHGYKGSKKPDAPSNLKSHHHHHHHHRRRPSASPVDSKAQHQAVGSLQEPAGSVDWRSQGAVSGVKDQGQCGSCWAFSAIGATEGAWALAAGKLVVLSEQNLVDCSREQGNDGCHGGLMDNAFTYIIQNEGIATESSYPYTATDSAACRYNTSQRGAALATFQDVTPNDQQALLAAVAMQPVSVAIEADQPSFQFYSGGVFNNSACGTSLDHGVLIVGFGEEQSQPYWIVKNSWGPNWGDGGYIRIARMSGAGVCGINMNPSLPVAKISDVHK